MSPYHPDTIVAIATAPGKGGVGILRLSGPNAYSIATAILGRDPKARYADYGDFHGENGPLDRGIALWFPGPHSLTGEDILELQAHGGPVLLDMLLERVLALGARHARPGEFLERAFLNDKMDLAQAEAVADLIDAGSREAAQQALRSLQGEFSSTVASLGQALLELRCYVESSIDFPEEEIDFLQDGVIAKKLTELDAQLSTILATARQGALLRDGMRVAIAGRPNAGKSSLLNRLAAQECAIVTDIPGTTRDVLREAIQLDGLPLHISDTAGLRDTDDPVEAIGVERAWKEIRDADQVLLVIDSTDPQQRNVLQHWPEFFRDDTLKRKTTVLANKVDRDESALPDPMAEVNMLPVSAQTGEGLQDLKAHLKHVMGYRSGFEGGFSARRRHLEALERCRSALSTAVQRLEEGAGELMAEDLRAAHNALGEITGAVTADALLGKIFASFCIGK